MQKLTGKSQSPLHVNIYKELFSEAFNESKIDFESVETLKENVVKTNVIQIFKQYSIDDVKSL